jgi:hypothetical protein
MIDAGVSQDSSNEVEWNGGGDEVEASLPHRYPEL